ncbi:SCO3374 family protein [Streptomyces sp. NPDC005811]|uniref:SCO3374 family protein n=1 Tax=Streptomyces sp. NPDC005811 TaxID=3154565 RepID=UPI0033D54313
MVRSVPLPRRPDGPVRGWYENELGWATVPGEPVRLSVGDRFDVLEVPAEAGRAALGRRAPGFPVALYDRTDGEEREVGDGRRMRLLVAAGSAEELPGILQWLEWGALPLDLTALGEGSLMEAPLPPGLVPGRPPGMPVQGAAVWLRPPVAGCEVEASLPTVSASGGVRDAPDLVRLVDTLAAHCHRVRLRRLAAQPLAFS